MRGIVSNGGRAAAAAMIAAATAAATAGAVAQNGQQAGVAGAVLGRVSQISWQTPNATVGRNVASGDAIRLGDRIVTGPGGRLQILLLDQSTFTIGPNASMVIDTFVYDPRSGNGTLGATVTKGVFRFVSGRISRTNPEGVTIKTPVATIGVRGTTVVGQVADLPGAAARFALTGIGPLNNTQFGKSWLVVGGPAGGAGGAVRLLRSGFMVDVYGPGRRSGALRMDLAWYNHVTRLLVGRGIPPDGVTTQDRNRALAATGQGLAKGYRLSQAISETIAFKNEVIDPTNDIASSNPTLSGVYSYGEDFVNMVTTNPVVFESGEGYSFVYTINLGARTASGYLVFYNGGGLNGPTSAQIQLTGNPVTDRTAIIRQVQALPGFANANIDVRFVLGPGGLQSVVTVTQQNGGTTTTSTGSGFAPSFSP